MSGATDTTVLVMATADWNSLLWTNKQYLACELAEAFDVVYLESLGLRRPELTRRDLRRAWGKVAHRGAARRPDGRPNPRPLPPRVQVRPARVIPHHRGVVRRLNRLVVQRTTADWAAAPEGRRVLWTFSPVTYGNELLAPTVYHCVDLIGHDPGIDAGVVAEGEERLAAAGAVAVASSREVARHLRTIGFARILEWPNVADVPAFVDAAGRGVPRDPDLVVFGGNLSALKLDCAPIAALLDRRPGTEVVLAGPIAEGGGGSWPALEALRERGVKLPGALSIGELAELYARASAAIVPYVQNGYTRGVLPLKIAEYLASGLPVVATALPSLDPIEGHLAVAATPDAFADAVVRALRGPLDRRTIDQRQRIARQRSWAGRGEQARQLVAELSGPV